MANDERELNESKSLLEIIEKSYYENMFKDGSNFINTREITEKLLEMILVSKGIDSTEVPDDDQFFFKKKDLTAGFSDFNDSKIIKIG
ncbi:hypothetical protein C2G38_2190077 [Gigaspora rosea]|uniref:Uncharacterized protein n=1 Tax=Gigaspora rosea TaxID=44941 RepID=A0A397V456_9GLOM|nr:hypothetical protein C2G38_2190077 [Gigaspora rosea]